MLLFPVTKFNYGSDKTLHRLEIDPGLIELPNFYYCDLSTIYIKTKIINQLSNCSNQSLNQVVDNVRTLPRKMLAKLINLVRLETELLS